MQHQFIETNLEEIAIKSIARAQENIDFVEHLQQLNIDELDDTVYELDSLISPQIDCTLCGNCCKTLMINVEAPEADIAARHLGISRVVFDEAYIEKSMGGKMLVNKIPCHFLQDNKCTIYLSRFAGCKEFPALHLPRIKNRLFTIFMHYGRCPIIYNVMEELKKQVRFEWKEDV